MKRGKDTYPPKSRAPKPGGWARTELDARLSSVSAPISLMKRYLTRGKGVELGLLR